MSEAGAIAERCSPFCRSQSETGFLQPGHWEGPSCLDAAEDSSRQWTQSRQRGDRRGPGRQQDWRGERKGQSYERWMAQGLSASQQACSGLTGPNS